MTKNLLPFIVFLSIVKFISALPQKHHEPDELINYSIEKALKSPYPSINQIHEHKQNDVRALSYLYYNKTSRRFYFKKTTSKLHEGRNYENRATEDDEGGFIDTIFDFFAGLFLAPFSPPSDRKPPKSKRKVSSQEDYDDDPLFDFFDGIEDLFNPPKRKVKTNKWFNWFNDDQQSKNQPTQNIKGSNKQINKDCNEKPNMPAYFGAENSIESTTQSTTATTASGWFGFLSDDSDDDAEPTEPSTGWFSSLFYEQSSTRSPVPTTPTTTTTTTTTTTSTPPQSSWFDYLINAEEDDNVNLVNNTKKKGRRKNYEGFQLLRIYPNNMWKVNDLKDLQDDTHGSGLMWWSDPALNKSADLLVPQDLLADVKDYLNNQGMQYDVVIWDLKRAIAFENPKLSKTQRLELETVKGHPMTWRRYHRYADILRYLEYLSLKFPDVVELIPFGRSSEGLPIMGAKVALPMNETVVSSGEKKRWKLKSRLKPAIWIDGGMHAREWISPAVVTWILHTLVEGHGKGGGDMEMLKMADWYLLPVANPDGYEYTHTRDRLWRKSRSTNSGSDIYYNSWFPWNWGKIECVGVDLNRNWDYHWGEKGASTDPCNDNYAGPKPFSEPETRSISNFVMELRDQMRVFLTLHAYSQMWVLPTTHSRDPFSDNGELMEMGKLALNALKDVSGTKYEIGSMTELLSPVTGTSYDWAKGRAGIKYAYAVKMRDSRGPYGFLLPGSQIAPTAKETWEAIKTVVDNL